MTSTRDLFRTTLEALAAKAKATLPESAGRIDSAVKLVLSSDVELHADGTATVGSRSNPAKTYSVNGLCECADFPRAPNGFCAHLPSAPGALLPARWPAASGLSPPRCRYWESRGASNATMKTSTQNAMIAPISIAPSITRSARRETCLTGEQCALRHQRVAHAASDRGPTTGWRFESSGRTPASRRRSLRP